jgi:hypothetical protein
VPTANATTLAVPHSLKGSGRRMQATCRVSFLAVIIILACADGHEGKIALNGGSYAPASAD